MALESITGHEAREGLRFSRSWQVLIGRSPQCERPLSSGKDLQAGHGIEDNCRLGFRSRLATEAELLQKLVQPHVYRSVSDPMRHIVCEATHVAEQIKEDVIFRDHDRLLDQIREPLRTSRPGGTIARIFISRLSTCR